MVDTKAGVSAGEAPAWYSDAFGGRPPIAPDGAGDNRPERDNNGIILGLVLIGTGALYMLTMIRARITVRQWLEPFSYGR